MINTSPKKQILSFSILVVLLAQINLDIFASNFRVSMGILLLPILIFLYQAIAVTPIVLLAGAGVYLSRVLIHSLQYGFAVHSLLDFFPELIFYYVYGGLFQLHFRKHIANPFIPMRKTIHNPICHHDNNIAVKEIPAKSLTIHLRKHPHRQ